MTFPEWLPLAEMIRDGFKDEFEPERAKTYHRFLATYDAAVVEAAIHAYAQTGEKWAPSAGELVALCEGFVSPPVPTWADCADMIRRAARRFGRDERAAVEGLYSRHPYFGLFAQRHGWERLLAEPVEHEEYGGAVVKRLSEEWQALVDAQEERRRQGLAVATLIEVGSLNGPRKLDVLAALGRAQQQIGPPTKEIGDGSR